MSIKKITTATALAAVLAMGAAPAFASDFVSNKADTTVSVYTDTSNISAELPLNLTVAGPANSGALAVPGETAYKIVNKSAFDIKVTNVAAAQSEDAGKSWALSSADQTGKDAPADGKIATLQMNIATADDTTGWTVATNAPFAPTSGWTAKAGSTGNELGIVLSGTISKVSTTTGHDSQDTAVEAVKLTYTVAPAGASS